MLHERVLLDLTGLVLMVSLATRRFGSPPRAADTSLPLHVVLRAPSISFRADNPASLATSNMWTVERLTLHAKSFVLTRSDAVSRCICLRQLGMLVLAAVYHSYDC